MIRSPSCTTRPLARLGAAAALLGAFLLVERAIAQPLLPAVLTATVRDLFEGRPGRLNGSPAVPARARMRGRGHDDAG
ncbi:hypothetical protein [Capillimicrobium parvum]|uniref:Uncharacterized protein n=1 Tax=Capillimicrobium parvum TaxID=2884022 RepID=A0A9E6XZI9_9ACTN|nr:hypothetical protein [Capillimicrobium parvum]UGS37359.1 hypothetical protein DSM104329_03774 [Capillimicrobium parvum]